MGFTTYPGQTRTFCQIKESTLGTAVTSETNANAYWFRPSFPIDINPDPGLIMETGAGGDYRDVRVATPGATTMDYSLTMLMRGEGALGQWMLGIMGSDTAVQIAATTAYTHTYSFKPPGTTMPSFTHLANKGWDQFYYNGAQIKSLNFNFTNAPNEAATVTANFSAWDRTEHSGMGTPSYSTVAPYSWANFAISIGDTSDYNATPGTKVSGGTLIFDRMGVPFRGAGNSGLIREVLSDGLKISGTFDVIVDSDHEADFVDKFKAGTIITNLWFRLQGAIIEAANKYTWETRLAQVVLTSCPETIDKGTGKATIGWEHVGATAAGAASAAPSVIIIDARTTAY